jgi:MFS transporter, DHA2 family, multidrug resistance protein
VWLLPGYVLIGAGIALVMTPASTDAMNTAPPALRGQASGVMQTLRQAGGTIGLAIMGTAVACVQHGQLATFADEVGVGEGGRAHLKAVVAAAKGDPSMLATLSDATLNALRDSLVSGISAALYIGGGVIFAGAVVAWVLLRHVPAADALPTRDPVTAGARPALDTARQ